MVKSKRSEIYDVVIKHLIEIGRAYPCFCTAEDVEDTRRKQERNKFRPGYYGRFATCRKVSIEEAIERIKNLPITENAKKGILGENLMKALNLKW